MENNFKYALFTWTADDEGGFGVCAYQDFTPQTGYNPYTGWRARPSVLEFGFNTVEEAVDFHFKKYPDDEWSREELAAEICQLLYNYHMNREEYDEASKYENYRF